MDTYLVKALIIQYVTDYYCLKLDIIYNTFLLIFCFIDFVTIQKLPKSIISFL